MQKTIGQLAALGLSVSRANLWKRDMNFSAVKFLRAPKSNTPAAGPSFVVNKSSELDIIATSDRWEFTQFCHWLGSTREGYPKSVCFSHLH